MRNEVHAQLRAFIQAYGAPPRFIDGHQHVHVIEAIRPLVLQAVATRGWSPWLRDSADRADRILVRASCPKKALGLAVLGRHFAGTAAKHGLMVNDGFAGYSTFDPTSGYGRSFERYLVRPGSRHLVMCHPGIVDDELRSLDPVVQTREQELAFLLSSDFRSLLERRGARLAKLSQYPG